jgi:hypothetical protein
MWIRLIRHGHGRLSRRTFPVLTKKGAKNETKPVVPIWLRRYESVIMKLSEENEFIPVGEDDKVSGLRQLDGSEMNEVVS